MMISQIVIAIFGCGAVCFATWITKNEKCLWALLIVCCMLRAVS